MKKEKVHIIASIVTQNFLIPITKMKDTNSIYIESEAEKKEIRDPNAMQLATVSKDGMPSVRTVLLKDIIDGDFVFYTNYQSAKAEELEYRNKASLVFWWIKWPFRTVAGLYGLIAVTASFPQAWRFKQ